MDAEVEDLDVNTRLVVFVDIDRVEVLASVVVDVVDACDGIDDGMLVVDAHADVVSYLVNLGTLLFRQSLASPCLLRDHECDDAIGMKIFIEGSRLFVFFLITT